MPAGAGPSLEEVTNLLRTNPSNQHRVILSVPQDAVSSDRKPIPLDNYCEKTFFNDEAAVRTLIGAGFDINWAERPFTYEDTYLHNACRSGNVRVVQVLLRVGADMYQTNELGYTPLEYVLFCQNTLCGADELTEILELFISFGYDFSRSRHDYLSLVTTKVIYLFKKGFGSGALLRIFEVLATVDGFSFRSRSPDSDCLYRLCAAHLDDVAIFMLEHGADPNEPCALLDGSTPLFVAESDRLVSALLAHGANPHKRMDDGSTVLFSPAANIHALVQAGVDVNATNSDGHTAFSVHLLTVVANVDRIRRFNAVEQLVMHGARLEIPGGLERMHYRIYFLNPMPALIQLMNGMRPWQRERTALARALGSLQVMPAELERMCADFIALVPRQ